MHCGEELKRLDVPWYSPQQTMDTNMGLVMAYWKLNELSQYIVTRRWVMGHADDKKWGKPSTITPIEYANIGCDEDTEIRLGSGIETRSFKPLPGYYL